MDFRDFKYTLESMGVTGKLVLNLLYPQKEESTPPLSLFFKPYQSPSESLYSGLSVITSPVLSLGLTLQLRRLLVSTTLEGLYQLLLQDINGATSTFKTVGLGIPLTLLALLLVVISPVVNFVDFIGRGVNTLKSRDFVSLPNL